MPIKSVIELDHDPVEVAYKIYSRLRESHEKCNSFITLREWDVIQREVENSSGPLKGLILPVKDNISTYSIHTTCGSRILSNYIPPYDAFVIEKLKEAGVVIAGKTNMDEFAMGNTSETSYFGPVKNPWREGYVPGGSSGGSAVATTISLAPSLGSDTGGSVRQPAAYTYALGLKPTYGLVSRYGLISYADSLEQIGILARYPWDISIILYYISEYDARDGTMTIDSGRLRLRRELYRLYNEEIDFRPEKYSIAYSSKIVDKSDDEVEKRFYRAIDILEDIGYNFYEVDLDFMLVGLPTYYIITMVEASSNLMRYDGVQYGYTQDLGDYFSNTSTTRSRGFGDEVKRRILTGALLSSKGYEGRYYLKALKIRRWISNAIKKIFNEYDMIIIPTTPSKPPKFGEALGPKGYIHDLYTVIPNLTGNPALNIPIGFIDGLPIGIQLISRWFEEDLLIKTAYITEGKLYHSSKRVW